MALCPFYLSPFSDPWGTGGKFGGCCLHGCAHRGKNSCFYLATGTFPRKSDLAVIGNRPVSPSVGETPVKPYLIALPFLGNYVVQQAIHPALLYGDSNWSPLARLISLKSVVQRNNLLKS